MVKQGKGDAGISQHPLFFLRKENDHETGKNSCG